ncbi:unnamed protein product [Blumeria hordei]|uniref:Uncharacterized protein n=1 Tax=Blumeria hordei TaxID=2867405 RepID=A0A383UJN8_BLUHO|nr:unnamed protein product [Blumeria hordei]
MNSKGFHRFIDLVDLETTSIKRVASISLPLPCDKSIRRIQFSGFFDWHCPLSCFTAVRVALRDICDN